MNKLEALLSHEDDETSSTTTQQATYNEKDKATPSFIDTVLSDDSPPHHPPITTHYQQDETTCKDESLVPIPSPSRGRTLSAMTIEQMREKVSCLSRRRKKLQKVRSTSALIGPTQSETLIAETKPLLSLHSTHQQSTSTSITPSKNVASLDSMTISLSSPGNSPLSNLKVNETDPPQIPSPSQMLLDTSKWDNSNFTMVVGDVVYVKMDYVKHQVEEIMEKYSAARREFKERERIIKKHFEKLDAEKTEKVEVLLKEFEEKCTSVQLKYRDAFQRKYSEKVNEMNEKIEKLMKEKEELKKKFDSESKRMDSKVSNVENKIKQNEEFNIKQKELNRIISTQKKLFFGLLNYTRSKQESSSKHDVFIQTDQLFQDMQMEEYRSQVEELKNILNDEQFEFQKVYEEKELRLLNELTESKNQLAHLERCMKDQTIAMKKLESQLSDLKIENDSMILQTQEKKNLSSNITCTLRV